MRELLPILPKPSHYAGLEEGAALKDSPSLHVALAFPDLYEVGMSYLGQKILYSIVNSRAGWLAERVFLPDAETAAILRETDTSLATLEMDADLKNLDALCFSVTHELCYTDILHMLDLAKIPPRSASRPDSLTECPLVMGGGGAMLGAEPLAPFMDLVALGDGEELIVEILECLEKAKSQGKGRGQFLEEAASIPGVYIPAFFREDQAGAVICLRDGQRPARRIMPNLDDAPFPTRQVVPVGAVHNRLALEIARGCARGCRFCHAGMVYRPVRERSPEKIAELLDAALRETGFDEASFLALSAGDHSCLPRVFAESFERCGREQISLALPSLRVGSVGERVLRRMAKLRRTGITLAPEAGSQRLRDVINKGVTEEQLLGHAKLLHSLGWRQLKLYFMLGLPTETDEDLLAIVDLCDKTRDATRQIGQGMQITAALSPFVPKPFTPFQWEAQPGLAEIERRIQYVLDHSRKRKYLKINWHQPRLSHVEGLLSRGGRRMADVVELAYKKGAVYCGWAEHFRLEPWLEALRECGLEADDLIGARMPGQPLPWSHLDCGVDEAFLLREREKAYLAQTTIDCRSGACGACGSCDRGGRKASLARPQNFDGKYGHIIANRDAQAAGDAFEASAPDFRPPQIVESLKEKKACFRLWHRKKGRFAFLSQLEFQGLLEKALRRAKLPLAFSGGYHPMPLLSFGRALPVGMESEAEWFSLVLHEEREATAVMKALAGSLPDDLAIWKIEECGLSERTAQSAKEGISIIFENEGLFEAGQKRMVEISDETEYPYTHKGPRGEKTTDLRPFLEGWLGRRSDFSIALLANWQKGYISPKTLVQGFLRGLMPEGGRLSPWRLEKNWQIINGRQYCQDLRGA